MKIFSGVMLSALVVMPLAGGGEALDAYRWKQRLLLVNGEATAVNAKLMARQDALTERNVVVFFTEKPAGTSIGVILEKDGKLTRELTGRTKAKEGEVVLLGKDGRTTVRWKAAEFQVDELVREIDSMPMRRKEAKE